VLLALLLLSTALAIRVENPGPAFYRQARVGKWGKLFTHYRFRFTVVGADKMKHDSSITRVGRIIRKLFIDSFWSDLKILLKTIPAVLFGKGAY
jgi:lipopolysaccharide/colanic/teichoic acid biosynthesis glycosyltransferase